MPSDVSVKLLFVTVMFSERNLPPFVTFLSCPQRFAVLIFILFLPIIRLTSIAFDINKHSVMYLLAQPYHCHLQPRRTLAKTRQARALIPGSGAGLLTEQREMYLAMGRTVASFYARGVFAKNFTTIFHVTICCFGCRRSIEGVWQLGRASR